MPNSLLWCTITCLVPVYIPQALNTITCLNYLWPQAGWPILFCGPAWEVVLAKTNPAEKQGEDLKKMKMNVWGKGFSADYGVPDNDLPTIFSANPLQKPQLNPIRQDVLVCSNCELVRPSGKAGKHRDLSSNPLQLSFLFKSCGLWTRSCDFVPHS